MSKEYDLLVGRDKGEAAYCDICRDDLSLSMEVNRGRCNACVEKEEEDRLEQLKRNKNYGTKRNFDD